MKIFFYKNKKLISDKKFRNNGFTLIEVLIACFIISVTTLTLMSAASKGIELSSRALRQAQASMITEEGVEAVKAIRDADWSNISSLTLNTNYYLSFNTGSNTWSLSTTPSVNPATPIDGRFTRAIVFSAVYRDGNDDIVASGSTPDSGTKRVTVSTSWQSSGETISKDIVFYISDIFN